jgi:glycosyltransferase involved in cell wall biosynthesis
MKSGSWLVCQIGAREHYAIPRALHSAGLLNEFYTDTWLTPGSGLAHLQVLQRLAGRYHPDLAHAAVRAPRLGPAAFELRARLTTPGAGWSRTLNRNAWFQQWVCRRLRRRKEQDFTLFSYSYAARSSFELARERGWTRVLGQIDPGPTEEQRVADEHRRYPQFSSCWQPAPPTYWEHWSDELNLADHIVVNSRWSWTCLLQHGVPSHKLRLIPLTYEPPPVEEPEQMQPTQAAAAPRQPFQLLFLGTIGLRKGLARLLDAMRILENEPVQLTLAGPSELDPQCWADQPNIHWLGPVPRSQVGPLYRQSQAMILPTLSDGFALTQLESLAYNCPVIASPFCGEAVITGVNGWILPSLEPESIAATILEAIDSAHLLPRPLQQSGFDLRQLAQALTHLPLPQAHA